MCAVLFLLVIILLFILARPQCQHNKSYRLEGLQADTEPSEPESSPAETDVPESNEPLPFSDSKSGYEGDILKGIYGDVPVYIYSQQDDKHTSEWRQVNGGIYIPNSKLYWKK